MVRLLPRKRYGPIGVDFGTRAIKLVQFSEDFSRVLESARIDFPARDGDDVAGEQRHNRLVEAIRRAREGKQFRGKEAVICLGSRELFLQNLRVPKADGPDLDRLVQQEAAGRVPFPVHEAEIRYYDAADVRQGESVMREVILLACHRPVLDESLAVLEAAGLRPVAVDVEPAALVRSFANQYRRNEDKTKRTLFVHIGYSKSAVVIAQGEEMLFVKYLDEGGKQLDEAVAKHLNLSPHDASQLRRHNGDRRAGSQDPEVTRSVAEAIRPVCERLVNELGKCVRYHSVTFRGRPIVQVVLSGGEATPQMLEMLSKRLDLKGELSNPFRSQENGGQHGRHGQWDVAAGLALREVE